MERRTITQTIVIHEDSAVKFEQKMNEALNDIDSPEIKFVDSIPFCAYITYTAEKKVAETAEDEYYMETGERAVCGECPYLELSTDKRVKYHTCKYSEFARKVTTPACELYYKRLLNGAFLKEVI